MTYTYGTARVYKPSLTETPQKAIYQCPNPRCNAQLFDTSVKTHLILCPVCNHFYDAHNRTLSWNDVPDSIQEVDIY